MRGSSFAVALALFAAATALVGCGARDGLDYEIILEGEAGAETPDAASAHDAGVGASDAAIDATLPDAGALTISPGAITVPAGRDQIFVALPATAGAVQWSVREAGGGTIDATGMYLAPQTPGTYHIDALRGTLSGSATAKVVQMNMTILTGALGGAGNADGTGTDARFDGPNGLAPDGNGYLYVSDVGFGLIRKVEIATGKVTTLAGGAPYTKAAPDGLGAAAHFYYPSGLAYYAPTKTLYVADTNGATIRAVDTTTGFVTTVAGQPVTGSQDGIGTAATFTQPSGVCILGSTLYISDYQTNVIRTMDLTTKEVKLLAGQTGVFEYKDSPDPLSAGFVRPYQLACAPGVVYVADFDSGVIRTIDQSGGPTNGAVSTLAPDAGLYSYGVTIDTVHSVLYTTGWGTTDIRAYDLLKNTAFTAAGSISGYKDGIGTEAEFVAPSVVATDGATLFIADYSDGTIRTMDIETSVVKTLAGSGSIPSTTIVEGTLADARFVDPLAIALDSSDNIYVGEASADIRKISLSTNTVSLFAGKSNMSGNADGPLGAGTLGTDPYGLTMDPAGNIWLADFSYSTVREISPAGVLTTIAGSTPSCSDVGGAFSNTAFCSPFGIAWNKGDIYVADEGNYAVRRVDPKTGTVTNVAIVSSDYDFPTSLATDGANKLWVGLYARILEIDLTSGNTKVLVGNHDTPGTTDGIGAAASLLAPSGLAYDGQGSLYVSDYSASQIRRIWLETGAVSTIVGKTQVQGVSLGPVQAATLCYPRGIVVTPSGNLLVTGEQAILSIHED